MVLLFKQGSQVCGPQTCELMEKLGYCYIGFVINVDRKPSINTLITSEIIIISKGIIFNTLYIIKDFFLYFSPISNELPSAIIWVKI